MRKMLVAKITPFFVLAFFLGALMLAPHSALAKTVTTITTAQPLQDGVVVIVIVFTPPPPGEPIIIVVVVEIKATDTAAEKAAKISGAIQKEINCHPGAKGRIKSVAKGNTVSVESAAQQDDGLAWDTTGENPQIAVTATQHSFLNWYLQPLDGSVVPPAGTVMSMAVTKPDGTTLPVSVTADGVMTAAQLLQEAMGDFEALGVTFTTVFVDEHVGYWYVSQFFEATTGETEQVEWNAAWSTYLGGAGVGLGTEADVSPHHPLGFGTVPQGTTRNRSVTVTNVGPVPFNFSGVPTVTGTNSNLFTVLPYSPSPVTSTCLNGAVTLNPNESCTVTVQFASPIGTVTTDTVFLNIYDNGGLSPQLEELTATN